LELYKVVNEGRHPLKKGDIPHKENVRHRIKYKLWREQVLEKDNHKCTTCNSTKRLHVHHNNSFYSYPADITNIDNGCTLCQSCHMKLHHKRGDYGRNK